MNRRGISMISLIVTIACIILLSSLSIGTGVKYLRESKARDKENFAMVLSRAILRREEETNLDSMKYPYLGYRISEHDEFYNIFSPKVEEELIFDNEAWYIIDKTSATSLGVRNAENYVNSVNEFGNEEVTVALVNYKTGDVYLIDMNSSEIRALELSGDKVITGHNHKKNSEEATCTEASKCIECGYIFQEALGHEYGEKLSIPEYGDKMSHYWKTCNKCGMPGEYEAHNDENSDNICDECGCNLN